MESDIRTPQNYAKAKQKSRSISPLPKEKYVVFGGKERRPDKFSVRVYTKCDIGQK